MTLIIEDTVRNNLAAWAVDAANDGLATGVVISPFSSPVASNNYKPGAQGIVDRLQAAGVEVLVDPETHALQMPAVGDFRYYDDWPFWAQRRGALADRGEMEDHVQRVFAEQDRLGVPRLAPTILLHSPQSPASERALELADVAIELDDGAHLAIAGDAAFWEAGPNLDAHVGALAQLEAPRWSLTVVRPSTVLATPAREEELYGLCRTARALSEDADVHISHGDLAGLPAIAAGARTLGTGWDPRQRVSAYASYEARGAGEGGQWFSQITFEGLLSHVVRSEAELLYAQDSALARRLLPGALPPAGPQEAFEQHASVLSRVVGQLSGMTADRAYGELRDRYAAASADWPIVAAALGVPSRATSWLRGLSGGLQLYGQTEGY
jgi:hypothetical protein